MPHPPPHPTTASPARFAVLDRARSAITAAIDSGGAWTDAAVQQVTRIQVTWWESADVCADVAWHARRAGRSALLELAPEQVAQADPSPVAARARMHLYLVSLRYDFRCQAITDHVSALSPAVRSRLDPYSRALAAFGLLGRSQNAGLTALYQVLADADDHPKTLHALLHGLWLGEDLPRQPELMLQILDRPPFAARTDPIALFRQARALRRLGRYRHALEAVGRAMEHLPPGDIDVHADLVRERALITAARDLQHLFSQHTSGLSARA